jgi:membrane protease subunit HflK
VTRERLYIDMMQTVLGNSSKVLLEQKGANNLLYLPLDKLIQQAGGAPSPAPETSRAPSSAPSEPSVSLDQGTRSRGDALRSRERASEAR